MATKGEINPNRLPPTERTAYCHTLRARLQIMIWETLDNNVLDPLEWGWSLSGGTLETVFTNYDIAPDSLLNFVRCKCKTECTSKKCSCRKNGPKCVTSCGDCQGDCTNRKVLVTLKETRNSYFCVTPKNHWLMFLS